MEIKTNSNLSDDDQKFLLDIARKSLESYIIEDKELGLEDINQVIPESIKKRQGGFVTLKTKDQGRLRGCIGEILPSRSALEVVLERVISAAIHDPRFSPVQKEELSNILIEISLLSPPEKIEHYQEIQVGIHGVILEKNGRSAVFLPQVAIEQKWNLETMLTQLSLKAGLSANDWKNQSDFYVFTGIHFQENL